MTDEVKDVDDSLPEPESSKVSCFATGCGFVADRPYRLQAHMNACGLLRSLCDAQGNWLCPRCSIVFMERLDLVEHVMTNYVRRRKFMVIGGGVDDGHSASEDLDDSNYLVQDDCLCDLVEESSRLSVLASPFASAAAAFDSDLTMWSALEEEAPDLSENDVELELKQSVHVVSASSEAKAAAAVPLDSGAIAARAGCLLQFFDPNTLSASVQQQMRFALVALRRHFTRGAYSDLLAFIGKDMNPPLDLKTLFRRAHKLFMSLLTVEMLKTNTPEKIPWIPLASICKFWLATPATAQLIFSANQQHTWPWLTSRESLRLETERRRSLLARVLADEELDLETSDSLVSESYGSINWLADLEATYDYWQPCWSRHMAGEIDVVFVHFRLFPDGLGVWTRREEGFYALLLTALEFPAATRVAAHASTVVELCFLTKTSLQTVGWNCLSSQYASEVSSLLKGVAVGVNTITGTWFFINVSILQ